MNKHITHISFLAALLTFLTFTNSYAQENNDSLFQTSIVQALLEGDYDGEITFEEIHKKGDFGLGTVNHLDGELIGFDGTFYQIKSDGSVHIITDDMKTPFAVVTFFKPDYVGNVDKEMSCSEFKEYISNLLPTQNIFYAIKVTGDFPYVKARSVPEQQMPYPPLTEVAKHEVIFEFSDIQGTVVGFLLPEYLDEINVTGYHFHFISEDKKSGGHVLDCTVKNVELEVDYIRDIDISLPDTESFNTVNLTTTSNKALKEVEENKKIQSEEKK